MARLVNGEGVRERAFRLVFCGAVSVTHAVCALARPLHQRSGGEVALYIYGKVGVFGSGPEKENGTVQSKSSLIMGSSDSLNVLA